MIVYAQEPSQPPFDPSTVTPQSVLANIRDQLPNLMRLVTAVAYVLGMVFIFNGLLKLKEYGEARTQMSREHRLSQPLIFLGVGAALLYLPTSVQVGLSTFWAEPNPYAYLDKSADPWFDVIKICFTIIQFVGVIAFIRGLVILTRLGGYGGGHGELGKGLTHIIGGILCINIYQFVQVIMMTLGIPFT